MPLVDQAAAVAIGQILRESWRSGLSPLHTIGYSRLTVAEVASLLHRQDVNVLVDIRSKPYSRFNPDFSRERLQKKLAEHGVTYLFLGRELGGMPLDPSCYVNGRANFERMAQQPSFIEGLDRLSRGLETHRPAIMCAEKEPTECHRFLLVSRHMARRGGGIRHIKHDGEWESQRTVEERLVALMKLTPPPMIASAAAWQQAIDLAYARRNERLGFLAPAASAGGARSVTD